MKMLYSALVVIMSVSGLYAMDDSLTKKTSGMLSFGRSRAASSELPCSKPELPPMRFEPVKEGEQTPYLTKAFYSKESPRIVHSPRAPSPRPSSSHVAEVTSFSEKKFYSLPTIPEKK